jgi:pumilio family protein 6
MLLLTLMDVVDDTVLVSKSIFTELQQHILDLATNKFGRIPLLYPFVGRLTRLLPPAAIAQIKEMDQIREATRYVITSDLRCRPFSTSPHLFNC